ncbi:hypothetical protein [Burkholderia glumae]
MKKFGLLALNVVVTLLGGWILAHIIVAMTDDTCPIGWNPC